MAASDFIAIAVAFFIVVFKCYRRFFGVDEKKKKNSLIPISPDKLKDYSPSKLFQS